MSTVEVAIEYILVGLLALCAFLLPFVPAVSGAILWLDGKDLTGEAIAGVVGLAYLVGVLFDKLGDTLLGPLEHRARLNIAVDYLKNVKPLYRNDPFPQDALEYAMRGDAERSTWLESLRSRIRICRGLAVFALPASFGIVVSLPSGGAEMSFPIWPKVFAGASLLLLLVGSLWLMRPDPGRLRTDGLSREPGVRCSQLEAEWKRTGYQMIWYWGLNTVSLIGIVVMTILASNCIGTAAGVGAGGAVVTLVGQRAWRSITGTYLKYLQMKMPELLRSEAGSVIPPGW